MSAYLRWQMRWREKVPCADCDAPCANWSPSSFCRVEDGSRCQVSSLLYPALTQRADNFIADLWEAIETVKVTRHNQSQVNLHMTEVNFYCEYFHSFTCVWLNCAHTCIVLYSCTLPRLICRGSLYSMTMPTIWMLVLQLFLGCLCCQARSRLQKD